MFKQDKEPYAPQDVLCVFKEDGTAAIAPIVDIDGERVFAESLDGNMAVPIADLRAYTGPKGRIFLYPTTVENVTDCRRIADLERSTVLRQITHFAPEAAEQDFKPPVGKIAFILVGIILLIIAIMAVS
ncbi:hypothetical protein [Paenibacillus sp. 453mf]|uniref:hypothetical protein n=1 Tax=Paenibacillus sp. 453mf TaxID=1761874 RepID=UPI0008EE3B34|nr:hypothetical protein [Paenibacillus sp. 453mf]SFT00489.1 hypothetical protein SAMN04488601_1198 [Paenibacillus sp. 453mf]